MQFNSFGFIFFFLPISFGIYFLLNKFRFTSLAKCWLVLCSLFFYGWANISYLPLILGLVLVNFFVGKLLENRFSIVKRKLIFLTGILFNIGLLAYFKYYDFFISNLNILLVANFPLIKLALPLGISFFTFIQIAYLVDSYRSEAKHYSLVDFALFSMFFPQLSAGPIVHHKEIIPQLTSLKNKVLDHKNISLGLFIFTIGLFKKVIIADNFAVWANQGFGHPDSPQFIEAWIVSLSYTFQLYFDFSGYTDMAIGSALLFNIKLPVNFNSPYKALNIQDFWQRWHMTLTRFLTKYVYFSLGGNKNGQVKTYLNIMIVFLISGLWHGASWTFIFWGFLHGLASIIHRYWKTFNLKMSKLLAWFITFNFINITWVIFRAETIHEALGIMKGMAGLNGVTVPAFLGNYLSSLSVLGLDFATSQIFLSSLVMLKAIFFILLALGFIWIKNSVALTQKFKPNIATLVFLLFLAAYSIKNISKITEFLYVQF